MRWGVITFLLVLAVSYALSQSSDSGLQLIQEARTTLDDRALAAARNYWSQETQKNAADPVTWYQLARVNYYFCEFHALRGDNTRAKEAVDAAIANVQRSIGLNERSAEAHSLLADLYGRLISFGGFFAGIKYGPKVSEENKRAVELDGRNSTVRASLGRQFLMAPRAFGGDVDKAIENLEEATKLKPDHDDAYVWLAMAYSKKGDMTNKERALREALRLNPRSVFAQRVLSGK